VAQALGRRTAVLTSAKPDFDFENALPQVQVHNVAAQQTTTFTNVYTSAGRIQTIHGVASTLRPHHLPPGWTAPNVVHLGPVANEVDPAFAAHFPNSLVGCTPQGWMRRWDDQGRVRAARWENMREILAGVDATILSREDLPQESTLDDMRRLSRLLVVTDGRHGCTVYWGAEARTFPAPPVDEADPTGAGDIFAAIFMSELWRHDGNPWPAAQTANRLAAASVTAAGLDEKLARIVAARE
jgi:sugar/nucleoside kinase (ribokinase family)